MTEPQTSQRARRGESDAKGAERAGLVSRATFDRLFTLASLWLLTGVFLDARSHVHGGPESFFTLEHAAFYTAAAALAALLGGTAYANRTRGADWREVLPTGYRLAALGVALFFLGGVADMLWHETFGIEANIEALLSPAHLLLIGSGVLFLSGPARAAWARGLPNGLVAQLPAVLSLTATFSMLTFAMMYAHPVLDPVGAAAAGEHAHGGAALPATVGHELGVLSVVVQSALLAGVLLVTSRRFGDELATGAYALVLTGNAGLMALVAGGHVAYVAAWAAAGLLADGLARRLDLGRPRHLRAFASAVPATLFAGYFLVVALTGGIAWSVHLWTGAIALSGLVGLLLSYVAVPSARAA